MTTGNGYAILLKDKVTLAAAALCLASLAVSGWFVFDGYGFTGQKSGSRRFTHMHCPACGEELPYLTSKAGTRCIACVKAPPYVPTVGSVKEGGGRSKWFRGIAFLAAAVIVLEALAYFCVLRFRGLMKAEQRERDRRLISPCPFCGRKISYPVSRAGTGILCSGCKTAFSLAGVGDAEFDTAG